jgi:uncharacterized repeat protein (TIGR03803 family)
MSTPRILSWMLSTFAVTALLLAGTVLLSRSTTAIALPALTFTTLHSFDNFNGAKPYSWVPQATDGNFYGTTWAGGATGNGTVFKLTPNGKETRYSFCMQSGCPDGAQPYAGLVEASNGDFYGTTSSGGAHLGGTVFKITESGILTTLYSFCPQTGCADGYESEAGLVQASNGDFYGTTAFGGVNTCGQSTCGTVFKITPKGVLTTLHTFDETDGATPVGTMIQGTDGDLYGSTCCHGGTVFKITPGGTLTDLHNFCSKSNCADGSGVFGTLVEGSDGEFYGTTAGSAPPYHAGTVFKITKSGKLTTLHVFDNTDGNEPVAGLVLGSDGNFYGSTVSGGANNDGTIFEMTSSGTLTTLFSFLRDGSNGLSPWESLVQGTDGSFYGTTLYGGGKNACPSACGTVFSLSVGLAPFVKTRPMVGEVGSAVEILGTNLTGTTSVRFNGISARFAVVSRYLITAVVPSGASTGVVQVLTPSGALSGNLPFRVQP